jgi:triacylglycerol lipase
MASDSRFLLGVLVSMVMGAGCGHELASLQGDGDDGASAPKSAPVADAGKPSWTAPTAPFEVLRGPPYPIVLAYGFAGFDDIGPIDYYYDIPPLLTADGHDVFVATGVDSFNDSTTRGAQLLSYVQGVLAQTGAGKVNLIAHSQGGLDARFVAHAAPDSIAALVTIATPNLGTPVADAAVSGVGGPAVMSELATLFGATADGGTVPSGFVAAIQQMTSAGAAAFNQQITDAPGVAYYSIAGRSNLQLGQPNCQAIEPGFISNWDAYVDPTGLEFLFTAPILAGNLLNPTPNDGLITVPSAQWGTFLGCVPADHFEEIGQLLGQPAGIGNPFSYKDFYRGLADWLVDQGF